MAVKPTRNTLKPTESLAVKPKLQIKPAIKPTTAIANNTRRGLRPRLEQKPLEERSKYKPAAIVHEHGQPILPPARVIKAKRIEQNTVKIEKVIIPPPINPKIERQVTKGGEDLGLPEVNVLEKHEQVLNKFAEVVVSDEIIGGTDRFDYTNALTELNRQEPDVVETAIDYPSHYTEIPNEVYSLAENETVSSLESTEDLSQETKEAIIFANLLDLPVRLKDSSVVTATMEELDIPRLPPVCIEVSEIIEELQQAEPEVAQVAAATLQEISIVIGEVIKMRKAGNELAPQKEQELIELCEEFFTIIKRTNRFTHEDTVKFIEGIMLASQIGQSVAKENRSIYEQGTHERKQEHDPIFGVMFRQLEDYLARAIGNRAVRNAELILTN